MLISVEQAFLVEPEVGPDEGTASEFPDSNVLCGSTKLVQQAGAAQEHSEPKHSYTFFFSDTEVTKPWQACKTQYGEIKAQQIRCKLLKKRGDVKAALKNVSAVQKKERQALARQLWFLDGILTTDSSWAALSRVRI